MPLPLRHLSRKKAALAAVAAAVTLTGVVAGTTALARSQGASATSTADTSPALSTAAKTSTPPVDAHRATATSHHGHRAHRAHHPQRRTPTRAHAAVAHTRGIHHAAHPAARTRSAQAAITPAATATSPLAGGPWGVYRGPWDGVYPAYTSATGAAKTALAKVALQPRVIWFASNQSTSQVGTNIRNYISGVQAGNPSTLVQLALFRIFPGSDGGEGGRNHPLTAAEQTAYKAWMNSAATAIGNTRAAVVLEPDLALLAPPNMSGAEQTADPAVRESLVKWAAQRLSALPHTTVYLDCGDSDWLSVTKCVNLLSASGIQYARGFALGATHYSPVGDNITYGAQLAGALATAGYPGKHFVIDTADNGRGFTWLYWHAHQGRLGSDVDNAAPCNSVTDTLCDTLGVPPTATTWGDLRLGLSATQDAQAKSLVDGYLWFGRPWLDRQASPFDLKRTLAVARSTPYQ